MIFLEKNQEINSDVNDFCRDCLRMCKQSSKVEVWCPRKFKEPILFKNVKDKRKQNNLIGTNI